MTTPKPEWVIYKNEQRIGQAVTWHKALANVIEIEGWDSWRCNMVGGILLVGINDEYYKIVKERG